MIEAQIRKLARQCLKDGIAISYDSDGNGYQSYVFFVREGMRYCVCVIDADILDLASANDKKNGRMKFVMAEIKASVESMYARPFSHTESIQAYAS